MNIVASVPLWVGSCIMAVIGLAFLYVVIHNSRNNRKSGEQVLMGIITCIVCLAASSALAVLAIKVAS